MSALDRPTADELRRGEIAAAVKNGKLTPQEAEAQLREFGDPRPRFGRPVLRSRADVLRMVGLSRGGIA